MTAVGLSRKQKEKNKFVCKNNKSHKSLYEAFM